MNVSPIDKSIDNESFQVERGLIKMERQKKPENVSLQNNNEQKKSIDDKNQSNLKIIQSTPSKKLQLNSIIITPNKALVENVEILNVLSKLYSYFLDHNLILNPMTELYFIIQLITVQYTNDCNNTLTLEKNVETISEINNENFNGLKKNLSMLKRSLNFDDLIEKNSDIVEDSDDDELINDKSLNDCYSLNVTNATEEHLNDVNNKLKLISVEESKTEIINNLNDDERFKVFDDVKNYVKINLATPHNCVYFSTQVLNSQREFIKCLDRVTLKLLCENNQIATFLPELCKYLESIYNIKVNETIKTKSVISIG